MSDASDAAAMYAHECSKLREQLAESERSIAELRGVIEKAHYTVISSDRIWGGMGSWVEHPLSTVTRKKLQRILENKQEAAMAAQEKVNG